MGASSRFTLTFAGLTALQMARLVRMADKARIAEPRIEFDLTPGTVQIANVGPNKIQVIKAVREVTGMGLKEAKDVTESMTGIVETGCSPVRVEEIRTALVAAGATVKVV